MTYTKDNIKIVPYPSNSIAKDLTGTETEYLIVLGFAGRDKRSIAEWWVQCKRCGDYTKVRADAITKRKQKSCGCLWSEVGDRTRTHGMTHTPIYSVWRGIIKRCTLTTNYNYSEYGGRGIKICERWLTFENFYEDMGDRPDWATGGIERLDNDGDYCPENCVWADRFQQQNNTRKTKRITLNGRTMTVAQWTRELNLPKELIGDRLRRGWDAHSALTLPIGTKLLSA